MGVEPLYPPLWIRQWCKLTLRKMLSGFLVLISANLRADIDALMPAVVSWRRLERMVGLDVMQSIVRVWRQVPLETLRQSSASPRRESVPRCCHRADGLQSVPVSRSALLICLYFANIGSTAASYKTSTNQKSTPRKYVHKAQLKPRLKPRRRLFCQNNSQCPQNASTYDA